MNLEVLAIEPTLEIGTFNLLVLVGEEQHKFTMKVESFTVANQEIQVTSGDDHFSQFFRFNQIVASNVSKLVSKVYNNQAVELPENIGEFYSSKLKSEELKVKN